MNVMQPPIFFQKEFQKYIYILLRVIVLLFDMLTHNTAVLLVIILDKLMCVLNHELLRGLASGLVMVQPDLFGPAGSKKYQTHKYIISYDGGAAKFQALWDKFSLGKQLDGLSPAPNTSLIRARCRKNCLDRFMPTRVLDHD